MTQPQGNLPDPAPWPLACHLVQVVLGGPGNGGAACGVDVLRAALRVGVSRAKVDLLRAGLEPTPQRPAGIADQLVKGADEAVPVSPAFKGAVAEPGIAPVAADQ